MPAFRTPRFAALAAATVALLATATVGPAAPATAAPKAAAPTLSIESKTCSIGATEEERSVTVTALALLGATGERVTMRFSLQSRLSKAKWKSVLFKDPTITKKWETTDAVRAGLKLTKTIPSLPEGFQYRVVVESRGVDANGKVVTRTAKRYVNCNQPLFTPTLTLGKTSVSKKAPTDGLTPNPAPADDPAGSTTPTPTAAASAGPPYLVIPVKNAGRVTSGDAILTVARADTRETLSRWTVDPIKGGATVKLLVSVPADCSQLYVTVQPTGAKPAELTVEQAGIVDCRTPAGAARKARR